MRAVLITLSEKEVYIFYVKKVQMGLRTYNWKWMRVGRKNSCNYGELHSEISKLLPVPWPSGISPVIYVHFNDHSPSNSHTFLWPEHHIKMSDVFSLDHWYHSWGEAEFPVSINSPSWKLCLFTMWHWDTEQSEALNHKHETQLWGS